MPTTPQSQSEKCEKSCQEKLAGKIDRSTRGYLVLKNLVLCAKSESNGFAVKIVSCIGVLEYCRNRNSKSQFANIKQITITKIQNLKPLGHLKKVASQTCFGHWILEFEIYL